MSFCLSSFVKTFFITGMCYGGSRTPTGFVLSFYLVNK